LKVQSLLFVISFWFILVYSKNGFKLFLVDEIIFCSSFTYIVSISPTCYKQLLRKQNLESAKKADNLNVFFALLGINAACRMLMKLTPGVNFIDILRSAFAPLFLRQKLQSQTVIIEKMQKALSYKNAFIKC